jgi:hypothetical protein
MRNGSTYTEIRTLPSRLAVKKRLRLTFRQQKPAERSRGDAAQPSDAGRKPVRPPSRRPGSHRPTA